MTQKIEGTETLYSYVKPINSKFARTSGKQRYGSYSAYIDALIARDRKKQAARKMAKAA